MPRHRGDTAFVTTVGDSLVFSEVFGHVNFSSAGSLLSAPQSCLQNGHDIFDLGDEGWFEAFHLTQA
jgi:hypothetical protein